MKDHYATLGLEPDCEPEEIKQAFRKLAQQLHPDVGGNEKDFIELKEAYEVLSDPQLRENYDLAYVEAFPGFSLVDADTGEDLIVEYEEEPPHRQNNRIPKPNPSPDDGWGLFLLIAVVLPILGFGFGMAVIGDPVTSAIIAAFLLLAVLSVAALVRERM